MRKTLRELVIFALLGGLLGLISLTSYVGLSGGFSDQFTSGFAAVVGEVLFISFWGAIMGCIVGVGIWVLYRAIRFAVKG